MEDKKNKDSRDEGQSSSSNKRIRLDRSKPHKRRSIRISTKTPKVAEFVPTEPVADCLTIVSLPADVADADAQGRLINRICISDQQPQDDRTRTCTHTQTEVVIEGTPNIDSPSLTTTNNSNNSNSSSIVSLSDSDDSDETNGSSNDARSRESLSTQPTLDLWLTRNDLSRFRSYSKRLCRSVSIDQILLDAYAGACGTASIELIPTAQLIATQEYRDQRGLERWSSSHHALQRSFKIVQVKSAVLLEQAHQIVTGKRDEHRLAKVASDESITSLRFAQVLAAGDAELARLVQQDAIAEDDQTEYGSSSTTISLQKLFEVFPESNEDLLETVVLPTAGSTVSSTSAADADSTTTTDKPWVDYALEIFNESCSTPAVAY